MTRKPVALVVVLAVAGVLALDRAVSVPPNPYQAPPLLALGSGLAPGGAHCSAAGS
ncbi:hypothetical protein EBL87_09245 [Cereibacter sphaeroides]|uniref:hypothetical protein n=1 Tax=Cereibacter sphaeroides TaxID=1063 RepID=UPI000F52601B|nr:hypothetical protein [Cereibacter sphaeroides]AZB63911.1 hypothetical protein EBL87_09245 [Cereibacter sphaeroides]AZB68166.1 hypothetical protein EBL86_07225 [Cereibacter sphaeroides]